MRRIQVGASDAHHALAEPEAHLGQTHTVEEQPTEAIGVAIEHGHDPHPHAAIASTGSLEFSGNTLQTHASVEEACLRISRHLEPCTFDHAHQASPAQHAVDQHEQRDEGHGGKADRECGSVHGIAILRARPRYTACMGIPEVDCSEAETMRAAGAAWIDVREPYEWEQARIADTELLPLQQAAATALERFPDLDAPIVVSCQSGARSGHLVAAMREAGYTDVHNLRGGIVAWITQGRPVERGA